ncbi:MAG TPA: UDP binding domain-containing protein, partial [Myxococcota bacterium]|nr:UDP binding domain-containing protein [Myxococcota bacterium]
EGADAVVVLTEWPELLALDPADVARRLRGRIVVDGRNMFDPGALSAAGLRWVGIGRRPATGAAGVGPNRAEEP